MNRQHFTADRMRPVTIVMGTKCFVSLKAMYDKLDPGDMDNKSRPRYYAGGLKEIQYSNNGIVMDYNSFKDEYKVRMYELTTGQKIIWVHREDLDFAI